MAEKFCKLCGAPGEPGKYDADLVSRKHWERVARLADVEMVVVERHAREHMTRADTAADRLRAATESRLRDLIDSGTDDDLAWLEHVRVGLAERLGVATETGEVLALSRELTATTRTIAELKGRLRSGTQVTVQVAVPVVCESYGVTVQHLEAFRKFATMPLLDQRQVHVDAIADIDRQLAAGGTHSALGR